MGEGWDRHVRCLTDQQLLEEEIGPREAQRNRRQKGKEKKRERREQ